MRKKHSCIEIKLSKNSKLPSDELQPMWDSETLLRSESVARKDAPTSDQNASNKHGSMIWVSTNWRLS